MIFSGSIIMISCCHCQPSLSAIISYHCLHSLGKTISGKSLGFISAVYRPKLRMSSLYLFQVFSKLNWNWISRNLDQKQFQEKPSVRIGPMFGIHCQKASKNVCSAPSDCNIKSFLTALNLLSNHTTKAFV